MKTKKQTVRTIRRSRQIDVKAGKCTYGEMVSLGRVLDAAAKNATIDADIIKQLISVLHPGSDPGINITNYRYARDIAEGVVFWREQENTRLKYEPSAEEKQAGYEKLAAETGPAGVASTIAEKFGVHGGPDEVFNWGYGTVFQVLRIDLERYKFNKRLIEIRENKRKQRDRAGRRGK